MELILCPRCGTGNQRARVPIDVVLYGNRNWWGAGQPCEKCGANLNSAETYWRNNYCYRRVKGNKLVIERVNLIEGVKRAGGRGRKGVKKARRRGYGERVRGPR